MLVARVQYFNLFYFIAILAMFALTAGSVILCRKKGQKFAHRFILVLIWLNFALHFLKQFLPVCYGNWPNSLALSGVPNLCAFFVVFGPLMYLSKNKYFRDYFFYIGVLSGFLVYWWPTTPVEATWLDGWSYVSECMRFYACHLLILIAPFVMVMTGLHKLEFRRLWTIPLMFCFAEAVIVAHCLICGPGLHLPGYLSDWSVVFTRNNTNESMQFGPQMKFDKMLGGVYQYYFPYLLTFKVGETLYFVPALWIMPLIYIGTYIIGPAFIACLCPKETKLAFVAWKQRRKMRRNRRNNKC